MNRAPLVVAVAVMAALACSARPSEEGSGRPTDQSASFDNATGQIPGDAAVPIESAISPPPGYERVAVECASFGAWLRQLPVRAGRPAVHLYDGRKKTNQTAHHAVLDVDVGDKDLQQCADAVIRLRAEYLFAGPCKDDITFDFTSGDAARWMDWRNGIRPIVSGNRVSWKQSAAADSGYSNFRDYLETVFMYAGSASLERELIPVSDAAIPEIGDVFIQGGFPGHAVLVIDVAQAHTGERAFLLAQSYMPAQDIHILRSFEEISPWYPARAEGVLRTPEWDFYHDDLRRFSNTDCVTNGGQTPD